MRWPVVLAFLLGLVAGLLITACFRGWAEGPAIDSASPSESRAPSAVERLEQFCPASFPSRHSVREPMGGIQEDSNEDRSEEAAITETSSGVLVQETFDQEEIPTAEELERRFGDIGLEELRGVESGIAWVMMRELKLVALEKYDLGMYDTEVVLAGEEFKRQSGTFPDGRMRSMYYQVKPLSGGLKELHSVEIHPTESPRIEAREVELLWLRSRIAELSREDPGEH